MNRRIKGEGSFSVLSNGKVRYRKSIGVDSRGKRVYVSVCGNSRPDCIKRMAQKENDYYKQTNSKNDFRGLTLSELCYKHLEYDLSLKGKLKHSSADRREQTIRNQIEAHFIGMQQIGSIKSYEVEEHIEKLCESDLSVSSVKKAYNVINAAFKWAIKHEYITSNPCDLIADELNNRFKKLQNIEDASSSVTILSDAERSRFVREALRLDEYGDYVYDGAGTLAVFTLEVGIRSGESCALRWKSYNQKLGTIYVENRRGRIINRNKGSDKKYISHEATLKNLKVRELKLSETAINLLNDIYTKTKRSKNDDYIFVNTKNEPFDSRSIYPRVETIYKACGFAKKDVSGLHILRRSFATKMYDEGAPVERIAEYIGDEVETVRKCYIAIKRKVVIDGEAKNIVPLPI